MRSPIRWFGGKGNMVSKLLKLVPPHEHYVEVFGGGASLLFAKPPCKGCETYLAYCDPPYIHDTRRKKRVYDCEMADDDHRDLVECLLRYKGAVMLSCYDHEIYHPLKKAGWKVTKFNVACYAAGRTRGTGIKGKNVTHRMNQRRIECVWLNPHAVSREENLIK